MKKLRTKFNKFKFKIDSLEFNLNYVLFDFLNNQLFLVINKRLTIPHETNNFISTDII